MIVDLPKFIGRYWIAVAVFTFVLLSAYTNSPIYGQSPDPTPDINTVPRPELLATPTNTPFPTPTPMSDDSLPGGGGNSGGNSGGSSDSDNDDDSNDNQPNPSATQPPSSNDTNGTPGGSSGADTGGGDGGIGGTGNSSAGGTGEALLPTDAPTGIVNTVTLNVRRGPSLDTGIIDTIFLNEPVTILGRDSGGAWWYICCGSGFSRQGWVSAQFVTLASPDVNVNTLLPIMANSSASSSVESAPDADAAETLILEMRPSPAFVWQGRKVQLQFILRNESDQVYTNVRLRNDLPPALLYVEGTVNDGGNLITTGQVDDGLIYAINWPEVPAGGQVTATITLQVAENLLNGVLIDNLAVVDTAEGAGALAGITFAMPPVPLPQFRR